MTSHYSDFINCFGLKSGKIAGMIAFMFSFLCYIIMFLVSGYMHEVYFTSPQKQVTDISLFTKDSDTESVNLSSLTGLCVSDGQKTDNSKVEKFICI